MIAKGRVCLKIAGREAGKYCVVLEEPKEGFVLVTGPKSVTCVKRRKCNIMHIEPTEHTLETEVDDSSVEKAWKSSGLIEKLGITVPEKAKEKKVAKEKPASKMRAPKKLPEKKEKKQ